MLYKKFYGFLYSFCVPLFAYGADYCTNPDEYTIDRRCYVTDEQKKEVPYSATVGFVDDEGVFYCSGTIVKNRGFYYVYTAKHCVDNKDGSVKKQINFITQSNKELLAELSRFGDWTEKDSNNSGGDWAIYEIYPDALYGSDVADKLDGAYVKIKGNVGKDYYKARLIGYGGLPILSDKEISDFKDRYIKLLQETEQINIAETDSKTLKNYGVHENIIDVNPDYNNWIRVFNELTDCDTFLNTIDPRLKVSYCAYSDTRWKLGNMYGCQSWLGNSGGGIFDESGNLIGILTVGVQTIGHNFNNHAISADNVDFGAFGHLDHKQK